MTMTRTLGGDRLGAGKKQQIDMKTYERSTHNLSNKWMSTMGPGTLVPFMVELGLPGDSFDIDLECEIQTHPTVGPLFGSYKVQLDVFMAPVRLYQAQLHNNKTGIGLKMADVKLPQLHIKAPNITILDNAQNIDNHQINPSCIFSYLNIRGIGRGIYANTMGRQFNAIPYLSYWDIYKNYYANKQEEIGAVIHNQAETDPITLYTAEYGVTWGDTNTVVVVPGTGPAISRTLDGSLWVRYGNPTTGTPTLENTIIRVAAGTQQDFVAGQIYGVATPETINGEPWMKFHEDNAALPGGPTNWTDIISVRPGAGGELPFTEEPQVYTFPLNNIDEMREQIMAAVQNTSAFIINDTSIEPYNLPLLKQGEKYSQQSNLEGLAVKTYQSDLFNNWIQTEWIDGTNGINEITSIDTTSGSFTIDQLNLSKKVYDMLNRIGLSGGTYKDWIDTVYTAETQWNAETPMYMGGLIKELVFQEVISNAEAGTGDNAQPLGTLAGRGVMAKKHKGGSIKIKVTEPSYIIGLVSLTPRIVYSQGNKWDVNLKTMDDFHKPALDEIGFQDLITDQMAWWDTVIGAAGQLIYKSAGKQPAWINYMTNVDEVRGNFAVKNNEMFMTLNRQYEPTTTTAVTISDLTTYIDPVKYNDIFAETSRDTQNFWVMIGKKIIARRKMSARVIPNL